MELEFPLFSVGDALTANPNEAKVHFYFFEPPFIAPHLTFNELSRCMGALFSESLGVANAGSSSIAGVMVSLQVCTPR
jgi:hypothetical protein